MVANPARGGAIDPGGDHHLHGHFRRYLGDLSFSVTHACAAPRPWDLRILS
jgi:hypothetical protein